MELLGSVGRCAVVLGSRRERGATILPTATAPSFPGFSRATVHVSAHHRKAVRWAREGVCVGSSWAVCHPGWAVRGSTWVLHGPT